MTLFDAMTEVIETAKIGYVIYTDTILMITGCHSNIGMIGFLRHIQGVEKFYLWQGINSQKRHNPSNKSLNRNWQAAQFLETMGQQAHKATKHQCHLCQSG